LRKSLEEIVEDALDELDDEDVDDVALDVEDTVMARSGSFGSRALRAGEAPVGRLSLQEVRS
jgi:hypothetical protein